MNLLAVDTSQGYLSVYLSYNGQEYATFSKNAGMKHSTLLLPTVDTLLKSAGAALSEMDAFGVVVGAGSCTGIRIGVATVKAVALSQNKPVIPVTSFDVIAYNKTEGKRLAVINARHGHYYVCGYEGERVDIPPCYLPEDEVIALSKERELLSYEEIPALNTLVVSPKHGLALAVNALASQGVAPENVQPLYVRKSQAEEGR